ncbi:hypothetical protein C1646_63768 [Rhizophagus diaphanus]|nr:hypothetical protein C1646_63768 [Rhizophagus diaphanus] [Rhizophagus sp. MUCL 43196]
MKLKKIIFLQLNYLAYNLTMRPLLTRLPKHLFLLIQLNLSHLILIILKRTILLSLISIFYYH